jgi:hypothetical protein
MQVMKAAPTQDLEQGQLPCSRSTMRKSVLAGGEVLASRQLTTISSKPLHKLPIPSRHLCNESSTHHGRNQLPLINPIEILQHPSDISKARVGVLLLPIPYRESAVRIHWPRTGRGQASLC